VSDPNGRRSRSPFCAARAVSCRGFLTRSFAVLISRAGVQGALPDFRSRSGSHCCSLVFTAGLDLVLRCRLQSELDSGDFILFSSEPVDFLTAAACCAVWCALDSDLFSVPALLLGFSFLRSASAHACPGCAYCSECCCGLSTFPVCFFVCESSEVMFEFF
jgi:hypothetical protein